MLNLACLILYITGISTCMGYLVLLGVQLWCKPVSVLWAKFAVLIKGECMLRMHCFPAKELYISLYVPFIVLLGP